MGSWDWLKKTVSKHVSSFELSPSNDGISSFSMDTQAAIGELSHVIKNNPDAVETYLALGNLYRSKGEIERAVHIRNNLIARPNLPQDVRIKALYELGRDFRRAGLMDRAMNALEQARHLSGDDPNILWELSRLCAESGAFARAADLCGRLGHEQGQAHYLVRLAHDKKNDGESSAAKRLLKKAVAVYPASVEAWAEFLLNDLTSSSNKLAKTLSKALSHVDTPLHFLLFEPLLQFGQKQSERTGVCSPEQARSLSALLDDFPRDVLLHYYSAMLLLACGQTQEGKLGLEKTLVLYPDFWAARLELLSHSMDEQTLSPTFENHLHYLIGCARYVKRFVCGVCGLKWDQTFFICPKCNSWHSIRFRMHLND